MLPIMTRKATPLFQDNRNKHKQRCSKQVFIRLLQIFWPRRHQQTLEDIVLSCYFCYRRGLAQDVHTISHTYRLAFPFSKRLLTYQILSKVDLQNHLTFHSLWMKGVEFERQSRNVCFFSIFNVQCNLPSNSQHLKEIYNT